MTHNLERNTISIVFTVFCREIDSNGLWKSPVSLPHWLLKLILHRLIHLYLYKSIYISTHKVFVVITFLPYWKIQWTFSKSPFFPKKKPKICKIHLGKMPKNNIQAKWTCPKETPISFNLQEKRLFHCYCTASVPKG